MLVIEPLGALKAMSHTIQLNPLHLRRRRPGERGYVLLALLLLVAVLSITYIGLCERIGFQIRRDREEELIHRGAEYSRAVRKYVKAFGRYPSSVAALENTNNIRFLRKRFKDPITGKDFQLLSEQDLHSYIGPGAPATQKVTPPPPANRPPRPNFDVKDTSPPDPDEQAPADPGETASVEDPTAPEAQASDDDPNAQPVESGTFVGVASRSRATTIREFNHKRHYNEWQFVYDPATDHAGLILGPNQPLLKGATPPSSAETKQQLTSVQPSALSNPEDKHSRAH